MKTLAALILAALLCACGGGDPDEDPAFTGPPDCKARPELCK
jgi:hypothetical protein